MARFELSFRFEVGTIQLQDGSFVTLSRDATARWCRQFASPYAVVGPSFELIYQLNNGRFLFARYEACDLVPYGDKEIWSSNYPPRTQFPSDEFVMQWMLNSQFEVPEELIQSLQRASAPPPPPRPVRPMSYWLDNEMLGRDTELCAASLNRVRQAEQVHYFAIRTIQEWRRGFGSERSDTLDTLAAVAFNRYPVDPDTWWGPASIVPPDYVELTELPWAQDEQAIAAALNRIRNMVQEPLAAHLARHCRGLVQDRPTEREVELIEEAFKTIAPEFEAATIALGEAIRQCKQSQATHATETASVAPEQDVPTPSQEFKPKGVPRRGNRALNIENLTKLAQEHLTRAIDYVTNQYEYTQDPTLLPVPQKKDLAAELGLDPSDVTRCFQDEAATMLRLTWDQLQNDETIRARAWDQDQARRRRQSS